MHKAFPLLSDRAASKRVRTEELTFLSRPVEVFPHYHVVHSEKSEKTARTVSPFVVSRSLTATLGTGYKVTKMASGDLLLELRDKTQFDKIKNLVTFGDVPITVTPHRSMNSARGVVSDTDLLDLSESELLEGWKDQHVTNVKRIVIRRNNQEIPTKHLILTFATSELPQSIETGYTKTTIRPYIPNPRRCFQCQRFGHGSLSCRGRPTCPKCGVQGHASDTCNETPHCVNCDGDHAAYSRSCPTWKKEKDIISLKVRENIPFKEARRRCSAFHGPTYAHASRRPPPLSQLTQSEPAAVAAAPWWQQLSLLHLTSH